MKVDCERKSPYYYKLLRAGLISDTGGVRWEVGRWQGPVAGPLALCQNGFHACSSPLRALAYVQGEILALVEGRGERVEDDGSKVCFREMRVVAAWPWDATDSVALAIRAATLVLPIWESRFPEDLRPAAAIAATERWLKITASTPAALPAWNVTSAVAAAAAAADSAAAWVSAPALADIATAAASAAWAAVCASACRPIGAAEAAVTAATRAVCASASAGSAEAQLNQWMVSHVQAKALA